MKKISICKKIKKKQRGFAYFLEAIIFMGFILTVATMFVSNYDGDEGKGTSLYLKLGQIGEASERMYLDLGCYPANPIQLTSSKLEFSVYNTNYGCNKQQLKYAKGPYLTMDDFERRYDEFTHTYSAAMKEFRKGFISIRGITQPETKERYAYILFTNVPSRVADVLMTKCNGKDKDGKFRKSGKCSLTEYNKSSGGGNGIATRSVNDKSSYTIYYFFRGDPENFGSSRYI